MLHKIEKSTHAKIFLASGLFYISLFLYYIKKTDLATLLRLHTLLAFMLFLF